MAAVAAAVKQLIGIRVPAGTSPGHVGGGPIGRDTRLANTPRSDTPGPNKQGMLSGHFQYLALTLPPPLGLQVMGNKLVASQGLSVDSEGTVFAIDFGRTG